jgi:hypothetical protein
MTFYLSSRKRANYEDTIQFYAVENVWDRDKKVQVKKQTFIGSKKGFTYRFNKKALVHEDLFRGTRHERAYWNWRQMQEAEASRDEVTSLEKVSDCDMRFCGLNILLSQIASDVGLTSCLTDVFGARQTSLLLSLAYYLASRGRGPLYSASRWSRDQFLPCAGPLTENEIARLLDSVRPGDILSFLKQWIQKTDPSDRLSLDITSVSSYGRNNEDVAYGYNRDHEKLPQINLLMMVSQTTKLPIWYRQLTGSISDITAVKDTVRLLRQVDKSPCNLVMDRGFASHSNISCLLKEKVKFTIGIPLRHFSEYEKLIRDTYDKNEFCNPHNTLRLFDEDGQAQTQAVTKTVKIDQHQVYLHLYYTDYYRTQQNAALMEHLKDIEMKLKEGEQIRNAADQELADKCFRIKVMPKRGIKVEVLTDVIAKLRDNDAGFFAIMSSHCKDANEALTVYKLRDGIEKRFDDMKNESDMKRLRMHSYRTEQTRLFLQFLAQILRCHVLRIMQNTDTLPRTVRTVSDLLWEVSSIKRIEISGHRAFYMRPTAHALSILSAFGISTNTRQWPSLN